MQDFANKTVVITGASGVLGTATYKAFLNQGAKVALLALDADQIPDLDTSDPAILSIAVDLTSEQEVQDVIRRILSKFKQIDVLINIAGGYKGGIPVHQTPADFLDALFNLNFKTAFNTSKAVAGVMLEHGTGSIVNIGARAGLSGMRNLGVYSASKSAVIRLTESMAAELKHDGIRVNCILPGTIDTPQNREDMPDADFTRWVSPESIADVIMFLASDQSRAVTGAAIPVYGRS